MLFFLFYWWLENNGADFGIPGEDINYTRSISTLYNGSSITINVMADGANVDHEVYEGRALQDEFLDGFLNKPQRVPDNPELNGIIGQKILSVAAGRPNYNAASGVAYASMVSSFNFYNATGHIESLEYLVCHHDDVWNISVVALIYRNCYDRECQYIRDNMLPHNFADECLYEAKTPEKQKHLVVPAGNYTSDIFFCPPGRWPLVFTVGAVSNRGFVLNHGCEGAALFCVCPGTRENNDTAPAKIPAALPDSPTSWDFDSFHESNASAAIFAGGLAIIMEANPNLTLSDHLFIVAMTATRISPYSYLWKKNAYGLYHNRRCGFGRLNLGKAVELAQNWPTKLGFIRKYSVPKELYPPNPISLTDTSGEINVTITVPELQSPTAAVVEILLKLYFADLGFGSFTCHLVSPNQDRRYELKILTEWSDLNKDIVELHLPSYQFLGENPVGNWTLCIPQIDSAARGLLVHTSLDVYYVDKAPDPSLINQGDGANPNSPIDNPDIPFQFKEDHVTLIANETLITDISINMSYEKCWFVSYLQTADEERQRLKVKPRVINDNTTLVLDMVPTVFKNNTNMKFAIEALGEDCGFTAEVNATYINNLEPGKMWITGYPDYIIPLRTKSITVNWVLNLDGILDDGYSTSVCMSVISLESRQVIRRIFDRNTGSAELPLTDQDGNTPSNHQFLLEISPSSPIDNPSITFKPIQQIITIGTTDGPIDPYSNPFNITNRVFMCILMGISLLFVGIRMGCLASKRISRKEEEEPFNSGPNL